MTTGSSEPEASNLDSKSHEHPGLVLEADEQCDSDPDGLDQFYDEHHAALLEALRDAQESAKLEPRSAGGVGILNQGATCYMNSLLQVLFHTPEFRQAIFDFSFNATVHGEEARCIPLQLQRLFAEMDLACYSAVSTRGLTTACGMSDRETGEQHDIQELCGVLFDALGRSSRDLRTKLDELYAGEAVQYIRSSMEFRGKVWESITKERFLDLQVPIQGCKTLEEALDGLVQAELLDGENQWECGELGCKVDALKGLEFRRLPPILHLQLMRFVFDFQSLTRKKLHDPLSIPLELDMSHLEKEGGSPRARYELSGICIQQGSAHGGHYLAIVKDIEGRRWIRANDATVEVLADDYFTPRSSTEASLRIPVERGCTPKLALQSTDAYYLAYRRQSCGQQTPEASPPRVPDLHASSIAAENQRYLKLQRAYEVHQQMVQVTAYGPGAAKRALTRYAASQLQGFLLAEQGQVANDPSPSITLRLPGSRSVAHLLRRVRKSLARNSSTLDVGASESDLLEAPARLRLYDDRRGEAFGVLEACTSVQSCLDKGSSHLAVILELASPSAGAFEDWSADTVPVVLCKWDASLGGVSLEGSGLYRAHLPATDDAGCEPPAATSEPAREEAPAEPVFDFLSGEIDLFADSATRFQEEKITVRTALLTEVVAAAARHWNCLDKALALVPLSGQPAGHQLVVDDEATLAAAGVGPSDIICVELTAADGEELQSVLAYEKVRNTAVLHFNHPDRPEAYDELSIAVSKSCCVSRLKEEIAKQLGLEADDLHLRREQGAVQIKDETQTLSEVGLATSSYVHVGHGAPCPEGHAMLQVYMYFLDRGGVARLSQPAFTCPGRGAGSAQELRQALQKPLLRWLQSTPSASNTGKDILRQGEQPWRRLRLRDAKAGRLHLVIRDEQILRSALPDFFDGREVSVQLLEEDEELSLEQVVISIHLWLVQDGLVMPAVEFVVEKSTPLESFQKAVKHRLLCSLRNREEKPAAPTGSCDGSEAPLPPADDAEGRCEQGEGADDESLLEIMKRREDDAVEFTVLPPNSGNINLKRCLTLKWPAGRVNATDLVPLAAPISDLKEIRDGAMVVMRFKSEAVPEPSEPPDGQSQRNKSAAKASASAKGKAGAKAVARVREERSLRFEVATPVEQTPLSQTNSVE